MIRPIRPSARNRAQVLRVDMTRPVTTPPVLLPASTSFDFLEGQFKSSERTRLLNLVLVGVVAVLLVLIGGIVVRNRLNLSSVNNERRAVQGSIKSTQEQLSQENSKGVVTYDQLRGEIDAWSAKAAAPVAGLLDYPRIFADLAALGSDYRIVAITITAPPSKDGLVSELSSTTTTTIPGTKSTPAPTQAGTTIRVQGTAAGLAQVSQLERVFGDTARFPYLSNVTVPYECSGPVSTCSFTLDATLNEKAATTQPAEIRDRFNQAAPEVNR